MREYIDIQGTITSYIYSVWTQQLRQNLNQFRRGKNHQLKWMKLKK